MRRVTTLFLIVALGACALGLTGRAAQAAAIVYGTVVDCHNQPIAGEAVTLSPGWTRYTSSAGYFEFMPETPGWYRVTVAGETRGPYWYAGITGPNVNTGTWRVCPQSHCRPPCEISDPGPPGPTRAQQGGDDDTPNVSPGDDDLPNGRAASRLAILGATPNPFRGSVRVMLSIAGASSQISSRIYDVRGRQVRTLPARLMSAGQHALAWDGRDDAGARVGPGVYFVHVAGAGRTGVVRVAFMP